MSFVSNNNEHKDEENQNDKENKASNEHNNPKMMIRSEEGKGGCKGEGDWWKMMDHK